MKNKRPTPKIMANRCLYNASFKLFLSSDKMKILGTLHDNYHGEALTTTNEAWKGEIELLQDVLQPWANEAGEIIFEYDIPRLSKRIDVVLLLRGIVFCLEFKVGQKEALQADVEQVMDYALDLKNFHGVLRRAQGLDGFNIAPQATLQTGGIHCDAHKIRLLITL